LRPTPDVISGKTDIGNFMSVVEGIPVVIGDTCRRRLLAIFSHVTPQ
jgi:hypothetical protein